MDSVDDRVICFMGFLQKQGRMNGIVRIFLLIARALRLTRPDARVDIHGWNCDVQDVAELILQTRGEVNPRLVLIGFSYGGWTAKLLADALKERGIKVHRMILIDAVYRHWYRLGWWRSLLPWKTIRICDTVGHVTQFRQSKSLPRGHKIVVDNPGKTVLDPIAWVDATHVYMDDQRSIQRVCIEAAVGELP